MMRQGNDKKDENDWIVHDNDDEKKNGERETFRSLKI